MCIFCKIAAGEIPSNKLYEDEKVLLEEARTVFPNTALSDEGMIIEV